MSAKDHLNWDQHRLTEGMVHGMHVDKEYREILIRAVSGGHPLIARQTNNSHTQILIKDDGMVTAAGSGGRGRGFANFESELRRGIRSVGGDFPRRDESIKAFQRRMQKNQGSSEPEVTDEQE